MTCKQLGGACNKEFRADTFEEMAELSKDHGTEMYKKGDDTHIAGRNLRLCLKKADRLFPVSTL